MPWTSGLWICALCMLSLFTIATRAEDDPCTVWDGDKFYDLSPLKADDNYKFNSPDGNEYSLNVCRPVVGELWAVKVDEPEKVAGFTRREHGDFALGLVNTTLAVRDGDPTMTLTKGSACPNHPDMPAAATIRFKCDTSVTDNGTPMMIAQLPPPETDSCFFVIEWKTHVACPTQPKGGWGVMAILATLAGLLLMTYIVVGGFYNYTVLGLRGLDILPRYSLFSLRDTINFFQICFERIKERSSETLHFGNSGMGGWRRPALNGGYRGLDEEQTGMLSGPPGYLDEMDEEEPPHPANGRAAAGMDDSGVIRL
ncbi:autophagy-related protein 27-like protein [Phanerochaete sordida]|uniref:Autophagy-related protein 27 n=1 Tax=Phanerochaete sordida TaxID=48140 RepID=A0A9P3G131_9APHY|nr:autophagy-related protein 27-like protein [Phanerochaete sordida]